VDWQERNVLIKAAFPLDLRDARAEFEIPFGTIARPADGTEVPALRWADASDAEGGAALLNDGRYGYDIKDGVLRLSLIRGATAPDPEADRGRHSVGYALAPHAGDWKAGGDIRRGYEFNNPLQARVAMAHPGALAGRTSFVRIGPGNVVLTSLKMASGYNDRGMIVRLVEMEGRKTVATVAWPWPVDARETDLIERPLAKLAAQGAELRIPLEPYEIKTVRVARR